MGFELLETLGNKDSLFHLLLQSVPLGVAVVDPDMRLLYINHRHASINYIDPEKDLNKTVREYLPQIADVVEPKMKYVFESGLPLLHQEIRSPTSKPFYGRSIHRLVSYYPWKDESGSVLAILALIQDSTLDRFAEHIQQESEKRLLAMLDNLPIFIGVLDLNGILLDCNKYLADSSHTAIQTGKTFWDTCWWIQSANTVNQIQSAFSHALQGTTIRFDIEMYLPDAAKTIWVDFMLAPLFNGDGDLINCIASATDISLRHDSEERLRESEERYRLLFESSDDAIITKSLDRIITDVNPAAEKLFGYQRDELIGAHISILFPPERLEEETNILERIKRGERVPSFETERIRKDGHRVYLSVTISPILNAHGQVMGACKIARDISIQKHNRELLEQALEDKTSLLHEVHHRVKNNLQIVSSLLSLQSRKSELPIQLALQESQMRIKAMALVHQLLYESNNMAEINLADYLKRLVSLIASTYGVTNQGIQVKYKTRNPLINLDIQRTIPCGLILNELLVNAVKHAFSDPQLGVVEISIGQTNNQIEVKITDNGHGLPKDFSWGGNSSLGKQLIPMFVSQLKGTIDYETSPEGTQFNLLFPAILFED